MSKKIFIITAALLGLNLIIASHSAWALVNDADAWGTKRVSTINGVETAHTKAIAKAIADQEMRLSIANEMTLGMYQVSSQGQMVQSNGFMADSFATNDTSGLKALTTSNPTSITFEMKASSPPGSPVELGTLTLYTETKELRIKVDNANLADGLYNLLEVSSGFKLNSTSVTASQALANFSTLTIYWGDWDGRKSIFYQSTNAADWQRSAYEANKTYVIASDENKTFKLMFNRNAVPEPSTFVMMGLGALAVLFMARRRKGTK